MITAKMRITVGLTCLSASVLLVAVFIGMIPDREAAVLEGRRKLCEAVAVNSSILVSTKDLARLEAILNAIVDRDDDILSAGIRRPNGVLEIEVGPHKGQWKPMTNDRSYEEQLHVPLRAGKSKWGTVEIRFQPLRREGWLGVLTSPIVLLATFCASGSFVAFMIYLGKMLQHLDPSQAVPRRVRSALDTLAEGLLVIDKDERIVLANQALGNWVNRDPSRLLGRKISDLPWVSDTGETLTDYPWSKAVREGSQLAGFVMGIKTGKTNKTGELRSLMVNATPVLGQDGHYRGVLISLDDVTQLETTKKELQVSKVAAEDANRAKSDFLARMSHEIRTPMNAILGYTDVLRQGFDETVTDRQDYLDTIHVSGEHLLALINDILDLSKIEAGHLELELQPVAPYPLISHIVAVFRARAEEQGIQLNFEFDGPIPATIQTDPVRFRQAIMNLVGNAIKFTEQGGVTLIARMTETDGKPQLSVDVKDTGIGISESAISNIFNPFSQADTSITRRFGGTGLGLAISLQLAEALGGAITVASTPGEGSTFTATVDVGSLKGIPLLSAEEARAASEQDAAKPRAQRTLPPGRVLVADDGDANRKLLQLVLGRAGMTVVAVENGKQAVEATQSQSFDVILMDMQMPVMDGYTATTTLRNSGCKLPIIALTAHVMQSDEAKCRDAGCSGFVAKPIDMNKLFEVVAEQMGVQPGTAPAAQPDQPPATVQTPAEKPTPSVNEPSIKDVAATEATAKETSVPKSPLPRDPQTPAEETPAVQNPAVQNPAVENPAVETPAVQDPAAVTQPTAEVDAVVAEVLQAMQAALEKEDFSRLASLAGSLHEAADVFGLAQLTPSTVQLELAARHAHSEDCREMLAQLVQFRRESSLAPSDAATASANSVGQVTSTAAPLAPAATEFSEGPLRSTLPVEDAEFREVVVSYVEP